MLSGIVLDEHSNIEVGMSVLQAGRMAHPEIRHDAVTEDHSLVDVVDYGDFAADATWLENP